MWLPCVGFEAQFSTAYTFAFAAHQALELKQTRASTLGQSLFL